MEISNDNQLLELYQSIFENANKINVGLDGICDGFLSCQGEDANSLFINIVLRR